MLIMNSVPSFQSFYHSFSWVQQSRNVQIICNLTQVQFLIYDYGFDVCLFKMFVIQFFYQIWSQILARIFSKD